jgi:flavin-dependent dehydrogenase
MTLGKWIRVKNPDIPAATRLMNPMPMANGVVPVGDAVGHNDPIIGQGLSI